MTDLTARQRRLIYEALTMVDPDTMSDNLAMLGISETSGQELDAVAAMFKPDTP